ncbi:radical SAM family heme chaperone HemW [Halovulum marinum]|uniref:radical SAM family heme chaperone HemW n=1 Tax=Halovulum marinum TaxID=2662447 RepID=UPI001F2D4135|nr:radical SAM family heme chaperone HemW [Halovulum marinum]
MGAEPIEGGFGLYVHWPFCAAKCPYCDFNSHVRAAVDQRRWTRALLAEMSWHAARTPGRRLDSIFFGGGTPSLMDPATVAAVIDAASGHWNLADAAEITLEANPTSVEAGRFAGYARAGVNRLSLGVQALNDPDLNALGRLHSATEARAAFDMARTIFPRISFDLIYARQGQSLAAWEAELDAALGMAADHLSLYQLTIEAGTRFGELHARGRLRGLPDDDLAADMYALTQQRCAAAGLAGYEVSNHARPGAEGRHNLVYWRYGEYVGIGPGAHGRYVRDGQRLASATALHPETWLAATETRGEGLSADDPIPPAEQAEEYLMMALRLAEGASLARHRRLGGAPLSALGDLQAEGLLSRDADRIAVTDRGRPVLNAVLRALLA